MSTDPPMEPMNGSGWWLESDPAALKADQRLATVMVRLGLAVSFLEVQSRAGVRAKGTSSTAEGMRDILLALLTTAAYTQEALVILTGGKGMRGERQVVAELARAGGASAELEGKIRQLCEGTHPASAVLRAARDRHGFHWDPRPLGRALAEFERNETVVWVESPHQNQETETIVHRLALDVVALSLLGLPEIAADGRVGVRSPTEDEAIAALRGLGDAMTTITHYFNRAALGYLGQIGARARTNAAPSKPEER